ncbi:MAG: efflux RND transporter permease subunit [Deltaproteobacteria bacterium]|nr:efflux RND transporter permease subunit [Deltaproteobacteria bacterium]
MFIPDIAVRHRTTVFVLLGMLMFLGITSYIALPLESSPDVEIPFIKVTVSYTGTSPAEMETLVTNEIEKKLKGIKGTKEIRSTTSEGFTSITIEFHPEEDIDQALQRVKDKVDEAKPELPDEADDPEVTEINISEFPIIIISVYGDVEPFVLKKVAETLEDEIETIPGVLEVEVRGDVEREIRVEFDMQRLAAYGLTLMEIINPIRENNLTEPGGGIDLGGRRYTVRIPGEFEHVEDINSMILAVKNDRPIYLTDLATVVDTYEDRVDKSRYNGKESVTLAVKKRTGENIIHIADAVHAVLKEARHRVPAGVQMAVTMDQSEDIREMVSSLENNILTGLVLVLVVILLFLGLRNAFIVALAIPYSMFITFATLEGVDITLNMVVLFSLILSLGMLVDNAIVIVENTYRHRQMGKTRMQAAMDGAGEVAYPVIASTLTTVCAFFPMVFWPGIMGKFMTFLPKTVIIALFASLFVAMVINPAICSLFIKVKGEGSTDQPRRHAVFRAYRAFLSAALSYRYVTLLLAFSVIIAIIIAYGSWGHGVELFPDVEPNRAYIAIKAPEGTSLDETDRITRDIEALIKQYPDIEYYVTDVGADISKRGMGGGGARNTAKINIEFKDYKVRSRPSFELVGEIREKLANRYPGVEINVETEKIGPPVGEPVEIEITGPDFGEVRAVAREVKKAVAQVPGVVDLKDNAVFGRPELKVEIDRNRAIKLGLSSRMIALTVKTAIRGYKVGDYRVGEDEYDIVARLPEQFRRNLNDVMNLTVPDLQGRPVPISTVARIILQESQGKIHHVDQKRAITVSSNVRGRLAEDVLEDARSRLSTMKFKPGIKINYRGESEDKEEAQAFLSWAFTIAVFLIALVLVTQFNSIRLPGIIMTSVILSMGGVLLGLLITGKPFGIIMTGVGVISLAGVVVNNAIVIIDFIEQFRKRGLPLREALLEAGVLRFRPVLLTAATTILSLIPMAVGYSIDFRTLTVETGSQSAQWWGPMASSVIAGLAMATILTLVVVPTIYAVLYGLEGEERADAEDSAPMPAPASRPETAYPRTGLAERGDG